MQSMAIKTKVESSKSVHFDTALSDKVCH